MKTNLISVLIAITIFAGLAIFYGFSTGALSQVQLESLILPDIGDCDSLAAH